MPFSLIKRIALVLLLVVTSAQVSALDFTFEYLDNEDMDFSSRDWLEEGSLFMQNIEAAAKIWGDRIDSNEVLEVWVYADNTENRAGGTFTNGLYLGEDTRGNGIFEPGPLSKILTGANPGGPPDMFFTINAFFVEENYWLDPTAFDRKDSKPPLGFTDFVSIMLHEFGHGFGYAGARSLIPGPSYGSFPGFVTPFDVLSSFEGDDMDTPFDSFGDPKAMFFHGEKASSIYGGPVPLSHVGPGEFLASQDFFHLGTCGSAPILVNSLMNGCSVPNDGTILEITFIDLAVLQDLGYPIITPVLSYCFSGTQIVDVKGVGGIQMHNLQVGDEVLIQEGQYEAVYAFGHREVAAEAKYLKLEPSGLELTPNHMVFLKNGDHTSSIPAMSVRVGDELLVFNAGKMGTQTVTAVQTVVRKGAYAPFTRSGTIVVNGVTASTFVAFQESESLTIGGVSTGLTFQWLARTALLPLSWLAASVEDIVQTDTSEGILSYLIDPLKFALWLFDQNDLVLALTATPMIMAITLVAAIELAYKNMVLILFGFVFLGTYAAYRNTRFFVGSDSVRKKLE